MSKKTVKIRIDIWACMQLVSIKCNDTYIGMTLGHLGKRVNEHRKSPKSACFQHEKKSKHKMAYDLAEIIDIADTETKLQAKEALPILREKPSLSTKN